ncbi:MAG: helix-turn-helix transcriptional regulator [Candidatus Wallbacteria bacterium]|nr:helix-turn-helix transcriptional regulator [Candidatus Wallbacteria bacterium]
MTNKHKNEIRMKIAQRLREARIRKGLTQEQLAEMAGITPEYVSMLERGKRNMTVVVLFSLAEALEVSTVKLVRGL